MAENGKTKAQVELIDLANLALIVGALIALAITGVVCWRVLRGEEVPQPFWNIFAVVIGFYFGSFVQGIVGAARGHTDGQIPK